MLNHDKKKETSPSSTKIICVEKEDYEPIYKMIRNKYGYFDSNMKLFTIATLIGKHVVKKREPLSKKQSYIRFHEREADDEMIILKCIAVAEDDDVNVLSDDMEIIKICEEYAKTGIHEFYSWINDNNSSIESKLCEMLVNVNKKNNP